MPAKKKRTKTGTVRVRKSALAALNSLTKADTSPALDEIRCLRVKLAAMEEITAAQYVTMAQHAAVVVELNQALADKKKDLSEAMATLSFQVGEIKRLTDERARDRRADFAVAYWKGEVERLHHELLEIHRERAREDVI
jgi:hypothetical protein